MYLIVIRRVFSRKQHHLQHGMTSHELSYATASTPPIRRWLIRTVENFSGRLRLLKIYHRWRAESAGGPRMWRDALDMIGTRLELDAPVDWEARAPDGPLIVIANHPFGIADGIAILSLAERLGRPYRVLINSDFMRLPEVQALGLPIDFNETKAALATNLKTRNEARRLLKEGATLVIFPAGGVATAENPFGKAEELPWKAFTARLIQQSGATVLPVYFEGQNSALFHFISRYSLSLRLALLVWSSAATSAPAFGRRLVRLFRGQRSRPALTAAPSSTNSMCGFIALRPARKTRIATRSCHARSISAAVTHRDPPAQPRRASGGASVKSAGMETSTADQ